MSKKRKTTMETQSTTTGFKTRGGSLGTIFDFSATSVLRALGADGVSCAHARAIMKKRKVVIGDHSCDTQIGLGRTKSRPCAPLTREQLDTLRACAKDPAKKE